MYLCIIFHLYINITNSSKSIQKAILTTLALNGILFLGGQIFLESYYPKTFLGCSYVVKMIIYKKKMIVISNRIASIGLSDVLYAPRIKRTVL